MLPSDGACTRKLQRGRRDKRQMGGTFRALLGIRNRAVADRARLTRRDNPRSGVHSRKTHVTALSNVVRAHAARGIRGRLRHLNNSYLP